MDADATLDLTATPKWTESQFDPTPLVIRSTHLLKLLSFFLSFPCRTTNKAEHQAWGGDDGQRELDDETNAQKDADREANGGSGAATPATPAAAEEEDKTQSYAEYLAAQAAAMGETLAEKLGLKKEARAANEGADEAQWKNAKPLTKDEDDSFFAGDAKVHLLLSQKKIHVMIQVVVLTVGCLYLTGEEGQEQAEGGQDLPRNRRSRLPPPDLWSWWSPWRPWRQPRCTPRWCFKRPWCSQERTGRQRPEGRRP